MSFDVSRRWFIGGLASAGAFSGCRIFTAAPGKYSSGKPNVRFGVVSDVHLRADAKLPGLAPNGDTSTLEHTLMWYRDQGVDAVAFVGDIADHGLVEEMEAFAAAWFKVFPDDRAPDGRRVERIVVYGNHDWGGVHYKQFVAEKYPNLADHSGLLLIGKPKEHWERIFREPWEHVYRKDVKGYAFIGAQWSNGWCKGRDETGVQGVGSFFESQKGKIDPSLPFFYFQHPHPKDTCYGSWAWGRDDGTATKILSSHPNAVAFSGHSHYSLTDERSIWQGSFTSLGTSSLRYTAPASHSSPQGYENASAGNASGFNPYKVMGRISTSDGRQGLLVSVYDDHVSFTRRDFMYDGSLGEDWVMPLPAAESRPFAFAARAKKLAAPEFPAGAKLTVRKTRGWNRGTAKGRSKVKVATVRKDVLELSFPPANAVADVRVYDYEIAAVPDAGGEKTIRYVVPEGFNMPASDRRCKAKVKCRIATDRLPPAGTFRFEVRPRNSFGKAGSLLSGC